MIFIKLTDPGTLQNKIYDAVRAAILEGKLPPGQRLPSTRELARQSRVSRNSVLLAYERLLAEGYVVGRRGSGTFVAPSLPEHVLSARPNGPRAERRLVPERAPLSRYGDRLRAMPVLPLPVTPGPRPNVRYDFRYGPPGFEEFPHDSWRKVLARRMRRTTIFSMGYGPPEGFGPLREALSEYLRRYRAVESTAEQVLIVNGSQQGLDLVARMLLDPGDRAVIEEPHYQGVRHIFLSCGAQLIPAPVDQEGIDVSLLPQSAAGAKIVFVTPSHQFPTGVAMSLTRRLNLLEWAERAGAYVIEDDYDSEYRYKGRPIESIQGLDHRGRVLYLGTFSKMLFPSLRVGYVVLPPNLVEPFRAAKWLSDWQTPTLIQEALADFIAEGHFERHLRRSRERNASRQAILLKSLEEFLGDHVEVQGEHAGLHLLVWLPRMSPEQLRVFIARAARVGVGLYPVAPYYLQPPARAGILMGFAMLSEEEIQSGIRRLAGLFRAG